MTRIIEKEVLSAELVKLVVDAPLIAKKALPGQFIILRVKEGGERIPLTIADSDPEKGTVTIIFQIVGYSTELLSTLEAGEDICDFVGPLGVPTELEGIKKACVIGGGCGCTIAYPQVKALHNMGATVDVITGFRSKDLMILEDEFRASSSDFYVCTDDGSYGMKGFVTQKLKELLDEGREYDAVFAIGPLMMMKAVSEMTKDPYIKTIVSMNSIMLDGTGMCGACRLTVGGKTKFACVDGPDFDGHLVDFDEAIARGKMYVEEEKLGKEHHECNLLKGAQCYGI